MRRPETSSDLRANAHETAHRPDRMERLGQQIKAATRIGLAVAGLLAVGDRSAVAALAPMSGLPTASAATAWGVQLGVKGERIGEAREVLLDALRTPLVQARAADIARDPGIVLALNAVESALRPSARSHSGAEGSFQLQQNARDEVQRRLRLEGRAVGRLSDGVTAALYLQFLREDAAKIFPAERSEEGLKRLMLVAYNAGPGFLRRTSRDGDTAEIYLMRLARKLARALHTDPNTVLHEVDGTYGVRYRVLPGVKRYLDATAKREKHQDLDDGTSWKKAGEAARYPELILALSKQLRAAPPAWIHGDKTPAGERKAERVTLTKERRLWSVANDMLNQLQNQAQGFSRRDLAGAQTREDLRNDIMQALVEYNATHAPFSTRGLLPDDVPTGTSLTIPPLPELLRRMQ